MIYRYARVSTQMQAKDGNSLEAQERLLRRMGQKKSMLMPLPERKRIGRNLPGFWMSCRPGIH